MVLNIAFIGAGAINFGEDTPWDHATRLEHLAGKYPLKIVGIADPLAEKAEAVLAARRAQPGDAARLYDDCRVFADYREMLETCRPDAVWVGVPPVVHGSLSGGKDIELQVLLAGAAAFVEKPISCLPLAEVLPYADEVRRVAAQRSLPISVGYMFRYSKPVQTIRELIAKHAPGKVCCFNARYNAAYAAIPARFWWCTSRSGGPLVEQGTHFIDLARYLCGEVDAATIHGIAIGADDASGLGRLAAIPASVQEETIPGVDRIPRASVTSWRFENGGLGVLNHALLLQGHAYENAITIWADGLSIEWLAPYTPQTRLLVRVGGSDETVTVTFEGDDMYRSEDCAFLDAVTTAKASRTRKAATPRGAVSASTAALPLTLSPAGGSQPGSGAAAAAAEGPATGKEGALSAADDCSCHTAACASCQGRILSSFEDATRTYMLSCQLRDSLQLGAQAAAGKAQAAGSS